MISRLAEDLLGAISVALKAGDMKGAAALIRMLAIEDPAAAQRILDVLKAAKS